MKQNVKVTLEEISLYDIFDCESPDQVAEKMKLLAIKYAGFQHLHFDIHTYYEDTTCVLRGERLETDEEYSERLKYEKKVEETAAKRKANKEQKDRELYEQLKEKYEDN